MRIKQYIWLVALLITVIAAVLFSVRGDSIPCSRAFYYWKSVMKLNSDEKQRIAQLGIEKLYVKYCDIDWSEAGARPQASLQIIDSVIHGIEIVPVVYITNKTFVSIPENAVDELAKRVFVFIQQKNERYGIRCNEMQIDCDWSDKTRAKYFAFLSVVRKLCKQNQWHLGATVRLHQVKYWQRTGIPPVDRAVLMFYNMGHLNADDYSNSIYNAVDARKYIARLKQYPLPFDVALPVFSWTVHSRCGHIVGLIPTWDADDISGRNVAELQKNGTFIVAKACFVRGHYLQRGDVLECETMTPELSLQAAQMLSEALPDNHRTLMLFHLDSTILHHYENKDIERLFTCFE